MPILQQYTHRPTLFDSIRAFTEFIRTFFGWWYGDIPLTLFLKLQRTLVVLNDRTSFSLILSGLFLPWKKDYNPIGWLLGIIIKLLYLPFIAVLLLTVILIYFAVLFIQLAILPVIIGLILINPFITP
jgi:hypothetical protein